MRKKREPESDEHRAERTGKEALKRIDEVAAEEKLIDAAIRQSIKLHGA